MKKVVIKRIAGILAFTHFFTLCFQDVSFAAESPKSQKLSVKVSKEELIGYDKKSTPIITGQETQKTRSRVLNAAGGGDSFSPEKAIKSFYLDPFSGALSLSLPIFTPPGRKGVQPDLNLTYSSRNGNGPFGWGWRMDFGYIERTTKNGVPKYDSTDTFTCSLGGKNYELISIGGNEYRSKIEGDFIKFKFDGAKWIIKDKQGNTYYFGRDDVSRDYFDKFHPETNKIFRWYLDGIKDINGNSLFSFIWLKRLTSSIKPVPRTLTYTKYQPDSDAYNEDMGHLSVYFVPESLLGESRKDVFTSFRHGSSDFTGEGWGRIKEIVICPAESPYNNPNTTFLKKYVFEYKYSQITHKSLLTKITEIGSDGTAMQPITFTYQDSSEPTYQVISLTGDSTIGDNLWNVRVNDNTYDIHFLTSIISDKNSWLYPHRQSLNWGPILNQPSGSDMGLSWNINSNGDLAINSSGWREFYAWTYVYVQSDRDLNISCSGNANHTIFLNANYTNPLRDTSIPLPLKAGYNLIEITGYNENNFNFNLSANIVGNVNLMNSKQVIVPSLSGDFNGDGLDDVGTFFASTGTCKISLSNGSAFLPKETWIDNFGINQRILLGDFNGDGKTDICAFDSLSGNWRIALSEGTKFIDKDIWISNFGINSQPFTGEFNGDGKTDIGIILNLDNWLWDRQIALNIGNTFEKHKIVGCGLRDGIRLPGDFNADGLTDFVEFDDYFHNGFWNITFNSGNADGYWGNYGNSHTFNFGIGINNPLALDFNGDGLTDIGYYDYPSGKFKVRTFNGLGALFSETKEISFNFSLRDAKIQIQTADYNGDGIQDFLAYDSLGKSEIAFSKGDIPDLLSKVENGLGGTLELKYSPYSNFINQGGNLPFILPVLSESIVSDGQGNSYKTTYSYSGGLYDIEDKEFRGFANAKVTDSEGNTTESYFKQDDIYKGRPYKQEVKDKDGNLYSKTENTWQYTEPYSGVYFPYLAQTDNYIYDGDITYKQTRTKFKYDSYGNPTEVISEGDVGLTGDEKTQITEYTYNTTDWLLAFPKHTYLIDQNQNKVSEKWFYYDNHTDIDDSPAKGLLTKEEIWRYNPLDESEQQLSSTYAYDEYGNLVSVTNPLGRTTTTAYDSELHIYPATITNPLGQRIKTTYDPKIGKLLTATDFNDQITTNVYDSLGRLIKVIGPNDTQDYPGVIYEYDLNIYPTRVTKKIKANYNSPPDYLTYYSFYDGLSRLIQTKSPAENDPQTDQLRQVTSGIVKFDQRGQVKEKYLPYFVNAATNYVTPTYNTPHTTFSYDPLGRLIQTTNPDLTYSSIDYSQWTRTIMDENSHYKTEYYDAYGRIMKIEEHNAAQTYTTIYEYDTLGNLTKVIDDQGNTTQIRYDSLGRKIKMDDPDMGIWQYEYDAVGNLVKQTDAKGQILEFTYDTINRLTNKLANGHTTVSYTYDDASNKYCVGRLSKVTDQSGATEFLYDNLGRGIKSIKTVTGSGSFTVERTYDALDRLVTLKYPDNSGVKYEYNPQGIEKTCSLSPAAYEFIRNIDYSPTGQITKIQYGNGAETNYSYNPQTLRLTNLTTQSPQGKIQDLNYQFDKAGNIQNIADYINTAAQDFLYDDLNRLIKARGSYGTFTYDYDSIGNIVYKEGVSLSYGKNGKLPHAVTQYGSVSIDYDENGNMIKKSNLELSYDVENRLIKAKNETAQTERSVTVMLSPGWNFFSLPLIPDSFKIEDVLSSIEGKYDQVSRYNPQTEEFEHYVGNLKYNQFDSFEYGKGYQIYITDSKDTPLLITGQIPETQSVPLKEGWNLIGANYIAQEANILLKDIDFTELLRYNKYTKELEKYPGFFSKIEAGTAYYLKAKKEQILQINNTKPVSTFVYDGDGGRVAVRVKGQGSGGKEEETVYIGSLFEIQNTEDRGQTTEKTTKHIFAGATRVCSITIGNGQSTMDYSYYHSDHLGSSNVITDASGEEVQHTEFTPYGTTFKNDGEDITKHKFTGKELDDSTGLYFYGARYYDPQIGRFISADTIVQAPLDPQSLNRYAYCRNNPLIYTDPTGHSWMGAVGSFFSGAWGAVSSFFGSVFSGIGGFFSGFFGGAFGRGGRSSSSGSSGGGSFSAIPSSSREGSGAKSSEVSQGFISGAWNFGSSVGSALGGVVRATTLNIGGAGFEGATNWLGGKGFRTDLGVHFQNYQGENAVIHALNINENDKILVTAGSRPLGYPNGLLGKISPSGHAWARWNKGQGKIDIGPDQETGLFTLTEEESIKSTKRYREDYPDAGTTMMVSKSGLGESTALWQQYFGNLRYVAFRYNSNYGDVGILYGAGANVSDLANIGPVRIIGFPNYPLDND